MRAQSQTMPQRPQIRANVESPGMAWLQRLYQWLKGRTHSQREIGPVSPYGTWDAQRERFLPLRADAAVDLMAAQSGASWVSKIYNI